MDVRWEWIASLGYTTHHWYSKGLTIKTTSSLRQRLEFGAQRFLSVKFFLQPRYSDKFYPTEIIRKRSGSYYTQVRTERQRWHFWISPEPYWILMLVLTLGVNGLKPIYFCQVRQTAKYRYPEIDTFRNRIWTGNKSLTSEATCQNMSKTLCDLISESLTT